MIFIPVYNGSRQKEMAVAIRKWRYDFKPTKEVTVYHTGAYRLASTLGRGDQGA